MSSALTVLRQTGVMFILILLGALLYKKKVFTAKGCRQLSELVLTLVCPVLIFVSFQKDFEPRLVNGLLTAFALSLLSHILLIALSVVFIRKNRNEDYPVERFAAAYSNCAFMGIPLIEAVYGSDGIFYLTAYIAVFNILCWTHGVMTMTGKTGFRSAVNAMRSPSVIAAAAGIVFFFLRIRLPGIILQPANYIASLNTPLAMLVSGMTIVRSDLGAALKKRGIYLTCFLKLLLGPALLALIFAFMPLDPVARDTVIISAACPTATLTVMFSARHGKNTVYASELFAVSTIASALTIPLILAFSAIVDNAVKLL